MGHRMRRGRPGRQLGPFFARPGSHRAHPPVQTDRIAPTGVDNGAWHHSPEWLTPLPPFGSARRWHAQPRISDSASGYGNRPAPGLPGSRLHSVKAGTSAHFNLNEIKGVRNPTHARYTISKINNLQ